MRKFICALAALIMLVQTVAFADSADFEMILQIGTPTMTVNGAEKEIDPGRDTVPLVVNGRTLLPVRAVVEEMGGSVDWNEKTQEVTLTVGKDVIVLTIDNDVAYKNGAKEALDTAPTVINGRTMLPIRFIAESFGYDVGWDINTQKISITKAAEKADIYSYERPVIDFSADQDGIMSALHYDVRYLFEQRLLPELIFNDNGTLAEKIKNNPEEFLAEADNVAWTKSVSTIILRMMLDSEEVYEISSADDVTAQIQKEAEKYSLHAYQSYDVDAIMLDDDVYCLIFNMAALNGIKEGVLGTAGISTQLAVVYDDKAKQFSYYLLENSLDGYYMLCSRDKQGAHHTFSVIENDKKAFVETVTKLVLEGKNK